MTNKEKYKQAFSVLQTSGDFSMEAEQMAMRQKHHKMKTIAAAAAACIILAGGAGTAYAADFGGIQRTIQLWIHGDQTNATLEIKNDNIESFFSIKEKDSAGKNSISDKEWVGTAGTAGGGQRPMTEKEIEKVIQELVQVEYHKNGSVWVYFMDQKLDITNCFKNDVCFVKLTSKNKTRYVTIKYKKGFVVSDSKYESPREFN